MKAVYFEKGGMSDVLQYRNISTPAQCGDDQVLVHIKAAGVNPIDIKIRTAPERFPVSHPVISGCDGAGIIEAVGKNVFNFKLLGSKKLQGISKPMKAYKVIKMKESK